MAGGGLATALPLRGVHVEGAVWIQDVSWVYVSMWGGVLYLCVFGGEACGIAEHGGLEKGRAHATQPHAELGEGKDQHGRHLRL